MRDYDFYFPAHRSAGVVLPELSGDVQIQYLSDRGQTPVRQHPGDLGYDLFTAEDVEIPTFEFRDVSTDIAIEMPRGFGARIVGRSSTLRKRGLHIVEGSIDQGYRGHLFIGAFNLSGEPVVVKAGERIAQLIFVPLVVMDFHPAELLDESERAHRGFGSTGL